MTQDTITPDGAPAAASTENAVYEDYWGVQETFRFDLPDGKQYFEIKPMDEGAKTRFQKLTNKGIRMNQRSQEATIDVDPSDERHTLIRESVVSYLIMQKAEDGTWSPFPCPDVNDARFKKALDQMLEKFNPKVVQDLEFFIRMKNPWMQNDQSLDDLLEERDRIDQLVKQAREREAGELSSANK